MDTNRPVTYYPNLDSPGTAVVHVPKGGYYLDGVAYDQPNVQTALTEPALMVDGDHTQYTFDTRDGVSPGFVVDKPDSAVAQEIVSFQMTTAYGVVGSSRYVWDYASYRVIPSRTSTPGAFKFGLRGQLARPDGTGGSPGFHASPYLYNLQFTAGGRVPADVTKEVSDRGLAHVVSTYAVAMPGRVGLDIGERLLG